MKKNELLHFTVAKKMSVNCSTLSSSCHFFCHLLESGLARINWIRAVDKICVEQLICCQKCRANDCRAIAFRAVHPHSVNARAKIKWLIRRVTKFPNCHWKKAVLILPGWFEWIEWVLRHFRHELWVWHDLRHPAETLGGTAPDHCVRRRKGTWNGKNNS